MSIWKQLKRPPWRTVVLGIFLLALLFGGYALWKPGLDVRNGSHDRERNGIWVGHGWLAADEWFVQNDKTNQFDRFRNLARIHELASLLREHHITDVFPHLCPTDPTGGLPAMDDVQTEHLLAEFSGFRVMPWIGGPNGSAVRYRNAQWRTSFIASVTNLLISHPGFAGVHLNVEPLTNGDADFLSFLEQLHSALPKGKLLSIAAYPPPTHWHRYPDVHWDENFFREVARRCDQMVVMMYDTALRVPKLYQRLMIDWTGEALAWSNGKQVLLGIPAYDDSGVGYHDPKVENLRNALLGIHRALAEQSVPPNYQGVAIYSEWEMDETEWTYFRQHFLK